LNRYFTILVVPEREKGVKSFRIPRMVAFGMAFLTFVIVASITILAYDYIKILQQVYRNKHLTIENRQLKEQIQLFQMKINALTEDMERIRVFEEKLKVITGLDVTSLTRPIYDNSNNPSAPSEDHDAELPAPSNPRSDNSKPAGMLDSFHSSDSDETRRRPANIQSGLFDNSILRKIQNDDWIEKQSEYLNLRDLYEEKIAFDFGLQSSYNLTKEWTELSKQSFSLAVDYARFDFKYNTLKQFVQTLEVDINKLDQDLLDRESFLKSTPSLMPAQGWVTSYYGPRMSHYAHRIKMHEGIDIGARHGKEIYSTADGVVTYSGEKAGFGNFIKIDHGYGIETVYAHAQRLLVKKGTIVKRGDSIATVGNTGYSTGPHVHYEVRVNETPVDPLYFILE